MHFDLSHCDPATTAFVFPGQGAHSLSMLDELRDVPGFEVDYGQICARLGCDPLEAGRASHEPLSDNAASSLLTVLASVLVLKQLRNQFPEFAPLAMAGYSVGQWTALYAAGVVNFAQLVELVYRRAQLMDACLASGELSGMLAVVGLLEGDVRSVCDCVAHRGHRLEITNENAPGQFTLGGTIAALDLAEEFLTPRRPKRIVRLPVAGAWHSSRLQDAVSPLRSILLESTLGPARCPIVDNTTGDWLSTDRLGRCDALARQVASPVRWSRGVKTMESHGVRDLIEVGYGDVLTKFGFFITRNVRHTALLPPARSPANRQTMP
jgi:[acyl-carrier-protein] S-malonyltransferase